MYNFKDQVAIITGGAGSIGGGVVKELLQKGAKHVTILDINEEFGTNMEKELRQKKYGKDKVKFRKCDVTVEAEMFEAFEQTVKDHGYIDVVINNAGMADERLKMYERTIKTNVIGVVTGTLKAMELMRKDKGGRGGTIINISSVIALQLSAPTLFVYGATKSAVIHLTCCLGLDSYFSNTNVRTITICFGSTMSYMRVDSFDVGVLDELLEKYAVRAPQSNEVAAKGLVEAFEKGSSGSVWLVNNNKPALDITEKVKRGYDIMYEEVSNTEAT